MSQDDRTFYLMMFCGLLLVKNSRAELADLLPILPSASARRLAGVFVFPEKAK